MQARLQDFNSFSIGLLADLEMSEQLQNKVFFFSLCQIKKRNLWAENSFTLTLSLWVMISQHELS